MAGILGKLKWIIGADTQPFEKGLKDTESRTQKDGQTVCKAI